MHYLDNIFFVILLLLGIGFFTINIKKIIRNIKLGQPINRSDKSNERWKNMAMIALGQSKMVKRPVAGILHFFVYVGFIIINIELVEIIIDGVFGTHRVFLFLGIAYNCIIGSFEILAVIVLIVVLICGHKKDARASAEIYYKKINTKSHNNHFLHLVNENFVDNQNFYHPLWHNN